MLHRRTISRFGSAVVAALVIAGWAAGATAQPAPFYAGKQITLIAGAAVGGGYDILARFVARHLPRLIPGNPTVIVQNMPAGGSLAAANLIANTAPKDGTVIALLQRGMLLAKLTNPTAVRFEVDKLNWLGSVSSEVGSCLCLAYRLAQDRQRPAGTRTDCRRPYRCRSRDDAAALQRAARNQIQDRHRLQRHCRHRAGDRARRGPGHRRLVLVEPQEAKARLAARQEDHAPPARRAAERP